MFKLLCLNNNRFDSFQECLDVKFSAFKTIFDWKPFCFVVCIKNLTALKVQIIKNSNFFPNSTFKPELRNNGTFDFSHRSLNQKLTLVKRFFWENNWFSQGIWILIFRKNHERATINVISCCWDSNYAVAWFFYYLKVSVKNVTLVGDISIERSGISMVFSEYRQSNKSTNLSKLDLVYLSIPTQFPQEQKMISSMKVLIENFFLWKRIYLKYFLFWYLHLLSDSQ